MNQSARFACLLYFSMPLCFAFALKAVPTQQGSEKDRGGQMGFMKTDGLEDRNLVRFLQEYYQSSYGGPENWAQIESIRFDGRLVTPEGLVPFRAYKKKPNLCKIVVYTGREDYIAMGFDGRDAWQQNTRAPDPGPQPMPPDEALDFIRDSVMGCHLLFPTLPGKTIKLGEPVEVEGHSCLEVCVTLPNGQTVDYAIRMLNAAQRSMTVLNAASGETEVTTHEDFRTIQGVRIPFRSILHINGNEVRRHEISEIKFNAGLMPWMFQRPSL